MLFAKYKYTIPVSGAVGSKNTDAMYGMVEQLIVMPVTSTNTYDINIIDKDGDTIFQQLSNTGPFFDTCGLPIGKDASEKVTMSLSNVGVDENFSVIFKVRERL